MFANCSCTIKRLLSDEESHRIRQFLKDNGDALVPVSLLGRIEKSTNQGECPHRHRVGEDAGYCSCEPFLTDWLAELGETANVKNGSPL